MLMCAIAVPLAYLPQNCCALFENPYKSLDRSAFSSAECSAMGIDLAGLLIAAGLLFAVICLVAFVGDRMRLI
jgi:hypothetical protein